MTAINKSILFVGAFPVPASLERYVSGDLAIRLKSLNWNVQITSRRAGRLARALEIPFHTWRWRRSYSLACVDLYSGPAFFWAEVACTLLQRLAKPFVLTLHGGNLPEFNRRHPARVQKLLSAAAAVTCPSPYLLAEMHHLRPDLLLLPNGLDLKYYTFREPQSPLRKLVWLRAFHEIYNPQLAVEVLGRLRKEHHEVRLAMIGPDRGDGSLQGTRQAARRLGVETAVAFPGAIPKPDVPEHLAAGDIFLNTANFDNTPVSVLEAMACGLPVVTTNVGGIPHLLHDGETALLVPPADVTAMSHAVTRLLQEPGLALRLAGAGRRAVATFDWTVVLPQWEGLLERMLPSQTGAGSGRAEVETRLEPNSCTSR